MVKRPVQNFILVKRDVTLFQSTSDRKSGPFSKITAIIIPKPLITKAIGLTPRLHAYTPTIIATTPPNKPKSISGVLLASSSEITSFVSYPISHLVSPSSASSKRISLLSDNLLLSSLIAIPSLFSNSNFHADHSPSPQILNE